MTFSLPEIQITSVILMGLLTLVIAFIVPHYTKNVRLFVVTRRLLLCATLCVTVHFLIQYILHKSSNSIESTRTMLNLLFGFPASYFFTNSLLYLLRKGNISRMEWFFIPVIYIVALLVLVIGLVFKYPVSLLLYPVAFIYAVALLYCSYILIRQFFRVKSMQVTGDKSYDNLLKWTQWSIFLMSGIGLGFPFIIFVSDVTARSVYGILTISVSFICILGILGYTLSYNVIRSIEERMCTDSAQENCDKTDVISDGEEKTSPSDAEQPQNTTVIDAARLTKITKAAELFVRQRKFTTSGITLKDAAREMDVTVNLLKSWLRTTEYTKFNNWIISLRIDYAKHLLAEDPGMSNDVVAEKCGFCDRQYFQAQFSKIVGVTPHKWIRGVKEH